MTYQSGYRMFTGETLQNIGDAANPLGQGKGFVCFNVSGALTAHAGGTQAAGVLITQPISNFSTVGNIADSATLPANQVGMFYVVANTSAVSMDVYPDLGSTMNGTANAASAIAGGATGIFICVAAGKWVSK